MDRPVEILLVEDNPGDVSLTLRSLRRSAIRNRCHVASTGDEALHFVKRTGDHVSAVRPDLILLDLDLPGKPGRQVLSEIKSDPELRRIPVVILSSSDAEEDIVHSYDLHANCYIRKPIGLHEYAGVMRAIEQFWFSVARLPRNADLQ